MASNEKSSSNPKRPRNSESSCIQRLTGLDMVTDYVSISRPRTIHDLTSTLILVRPWVTAEKPSPHTRRSTTIQTIQATSSLGFQNRGSATIPAKNLLPVAPRTATRHHPRNHGFPTFVWRGYRKHKTHDERDEAQVEESRAIVHDLAISPQPLMTAHGERNWKSTRHRRHTVRQKQ